MPQFESESLVLRTYDLAEADRIAVFLTREHGIIRGVAHGAKRLKSRFGSTLELFSEIELEFFQKEDRELVAINRIELISSGFRFATVPEVVNTLVYISDLLLAFVPPQAPNANVYRLTKAILQVSLEEEGARRSALAYFELWLLKLEGYLPDWRSCERCGRQLAYHEPVVLTSAFDLVCGKCRPSGELPAISTSARRLFARIQQETPATFAAAGSAEPQGIDELSGILRRMISHVLGREITPKFPAASSGSV